MTFTINYNTFLTLEIESDSLDEAMEYCVDNAEYTQKDIDIIQDGLIVATLKWYGIAPCDDDIVAVDFGDFGFYSWE